MRRFIVVVIAILHISASVAAAPNAPSNLVATSTGSSVTLTWSAPAGGDAPTTYSIT